MILNPNCSEQVFKLTGTLDDIKNEVFKMLDIISEDYPNDSRVSESKKQVRAIKTLEEFREFVIPYSCNYETYFQPDTNGDLHVATCNNYIWSPVNYSDSYTDDYYEIAGKKDYKQICRGDDWIFLERDMEESDSRKDIFPKTLLLESLDGNKIPKIEDVYSFSKGSRTIHYNGKDKYSIISNNTYNLKLVDKNTKRYDKLAQELFIEVL